MANTVYGRAEHARQTMPFPGSMDSRSGRHCGKPPGGIPQCDAFVFCNPPARMTWGEFDAAVDRVSRGLLALGFAPGDHFGVWATNVPEWVLLQFATARIGVVLVNINPAYRTGELKYALRQSDVRGLALVDCFKIVKLFRHAQRSLSGACRDRTRRTAERGVSQTAMGRLAARRPAARACCLGTSCCIAPTMCAPRHGSKK